MKSTTKCKITIFMSLYSIILLFSMNLLASTRYSIAQDKCGKKETIGIFLEEKKTHRKEYTLLYPASKINCIAASIIGEPQYVQIERQERVSF